jgi:hypothetical protein
VAFTVETGAGLSDATSLTSVAYADAYHDDRNNAAWALLTTDVKQGLLIQATDYLHNAAVYPWKGRPTTTTQSLAWPRTGVTETYGNPVATNVVPDKVQQATADLALVANTTTLQPVAATAAAGVKRRKVDVLEIEYFQDAATSANPATLTAQTTAAFGLLQPLLRTTGDSLSTAMPVADLPPKVEVDRASRPLFYVGQHDNAQN